MEIPKIYEKEYQFCLLLWKHEPLGSGELVKLCGEKLNWKPTTTYTVIRRLSERGVLKNENSTVRSLVSREQVQLSELDALIDRVFEGSFPDLIACLTSRRPRLSAEELEQVTRRIERYRSDLEFMRVSSLVGSYWSRQPK